MHRQSLLQTLNQFEAFWLRGSVPDSFASFCHQKEVLVRFREFVNTNEQCFQRENTYGHVTGSAFILSKDLKRVLLTFHAKLKIWIQLGGHADGELLVHKVAMKEAIEESALKHLVFVNFFEDSNVLPVPLDIDIHHIPKNKNDSEHKHFDVTFLLHSDEEDVFSISEESLDLKWVLLDEVKAFTDEEAVIRPIEKIKYLLKTHLAFSTR
jgi:hypothetical protein